MSHLSDIPGQVTGSNGIFGHEPEEIGPIKETGKFSSEFIAEPRSGLGQAFLGHDRICLKKAFQATQVVRIDQADGFVEQLIKIMGLHKKTILGAIGETRLKKDWPNRLKQGSGARPQWRKYLPKGCFEESAPPCETLT